MLRYPLARYHRMTGQMRLVMSEREEASLGPMWGAAQTDVRYPPNPVPVVEPEFSPPVFSVEIPETK